MTDPYRRDDLDDIDIDPDEVLATRADEDTTRDPGADMEEEQGLPADDRTVLGDVPDPQPPAVPTDEPVGSVSHGTTRLEQAEGESMETKLQREEPDRPAGDQSRAAADEAAVHVHDVSPLSPDLPPQADELPRPEDELVVDPDDLATADEPEPSAPDEADW